MTESNKIDWKSSQILKVFGTTIRGGTFTGSRPTDAGTVTRDEPTEFTPEYIQMLYRNASTPIEFVLTHRNGQNDTIGFTAKVGVNDEKDDLKYEGFVFDENAYRKITMEGFGYVSPEIVESRDANGNLIDARITRIAFVQHPAVPNGAAISGTDVGMEPIVFSKGTANDTVDNNMTEDVKTTTDASSNQTESKVNSDATVTPPAPQVVTPTVTPKAPVGNNTPIVESDDKIDSMMKELSETKSTVETLRKHNEKLLNEQYNGMVSELKTLGVENPAEIVKGLDTEQKLDVLGKLKGTLAKNKPMATSTTSTTTQDSVVSKDRAIDEALTSLGYRKADYNKLIENSNKR